LIREYGIKYSTYNLPLALGSSKPTGNVVFTAWRQGFTYEGIMEQHKTHLQRAIDLFKAVNGFYPAEALILKWRIRLGGFAELRRS